LSSARCRRKQPDDDYHEDNGESNGPHFIGWPSKRRSIHRVENHLDAGGSVWFDSFDFGLNPVRHIDRVGLRLFDDGEKNAGAPVVAGDSALVLDPRHRASTHITQPYQLVRLIAHYKLVITPPCFESPRSQLSSRAPGSRLVRWEARRSAVCNARSTSRNRDLVGGHFFRVEPEPHLKSVAPRR
jgi:hypothetical protein